MSVQLERLQFGNQVLGPWYEATQCLSCLRDDGWHLDLHQDEKKEAIKASVQTKLQQTFSVIVKYKLYLLSSDQIYAALFAIGHLSTEVIQDQKLAPAALQQHHLVLHLWEVQQMHLM